MGAFSMIEEALAVNSLEAKLWAIRDGLIICNQLLIRALYIELDAKAVIRLLTSKDDSYAQYAPIIDHCRNLLNLYPNWKIQHCYREANACADALLFIANRIFVY
ncbi:hypothetical protein SO802_014204 [Lithocarpus litseifolius]|uniref:RNase H type-1 domain-containing protein n=1 Tax=Lithocarpus litseifolius TaxID=425828 RepID=A0AAW2CQC1_9ROSI